MNFNRWMLEVLKGHKRGAFSLREVQKDRAAYANTQSLKSKACLEKHKCRAQNGWSIKVKGRLMRNRNGKEVGDKSESILYPIVYVIFFTLKTACFKQNSFEQTSGYQ